MLRPERKPYFSSVLFFTLSAPSATFSEVLLTPFFTVFLVALPVFLAALPVALPAFFNSLPATLKSSLGPTCCPQTSNQPASRMPRANEVIFNMLC
jgi:hypothetical protein